VQVAVANWAHLDGYAVAHGMPDLRELPLERFCNFVWYMMTRNAEPREVDRLQQQLWVPPKSERNKPIPKASPWSAENETAALKAAIATLAGG
jgi:hypothetical protein